VTGPEGPVKETFAGGLSRREWRPVTGGRRARILAELGDDADVTAVRLCEVCKGVTGMSRAGIMLMSGDLPLGSWGPPARSAP